MQRLTRAPCPSGCLLTGRSAASSLSQVPSLGRMCYLTTVVGSFHGRVLAARLGSEGIVVVLKGASEGPYPLQGAVDVLVPADQLSLAREVLIGDAVDNALEGVQLEDASSGAAGLSDGLSLLPEVPLGDPADTFTLRGRETEGSGRRRELRGLPAALVLVVVAMLVVVGCVAALVH